MSGLIFDLANVAAALWEVRCERTSSDTCPIGARDGPGVDELAGEGRVNDRELWSASLAEFLGPFTLVFAGVGAIISTQNLE